MVLISFKANGSKEKDCAAKKGLTVIKWRFV